jgi:hypothetical protein
MHLCVKMSKIVHIILQFPLYRYGRGKYNIAVALF